MDSDIDALIRALAPRQKRLSGPYNQIILIGHTGQWRELHLSGTGRFKTHVIANIDELKAGLQLVITIWRLASDMQKQVELGVNVNEVEKVSIAKTIFLQSK